MRIGIDIDDTIADSYEVFFAYAQYYTINELKRSGKVKDYVAKHHSYIRAMHNWTEEEEDIFWDKYFDEIISQIKPFTFAPEMIKKLKNDGNEIIIITARYNDGKTNVERISKEWLEKNNIPFDEFYFNAQDKGVVAKEKNIDIFIDDSFTNCIKVANEGIQTFLMNSRTNKGLEDEKITRVYSWPDVYSKMN